jgi:hypothetical protein
MKRQIRFVGLLVSVIFKLAIFFSEYMSPEIVLRTGHGREVVSRLNLHEILLNLIFIGLVEFGNFNV